MSWPLHPAANSPPSAPQPENHGPLVSVVTPFHNEAPYLANAIETVLGQTHSNFDFILVDNASTDGSAEIAERYAKTDSRIRLIRHQTLLPQLVNFNQGLREISPESRYVKMLMGDDALYPECLEQMVALAERHPGVAIVSSYHISWNEDVHGGGFPLSQEWLPGTEVCRLQLLQGRFFWGSPTALLYRADLVRARAPFFTETSLHPDTELCYEVLRDAGFGFVHQVLSFLRKDNLSLLRRIESYDWRLLDRYIVLRKYGSWYLSPAELERALKEGAGDYWSRLGESALFGREPAYWEHHRRGLATVGERLGARTLANPITRAVLSALAHPRWALSRARECREHRRKPLPSR